MTVGFPHSTMPTGWFQVAWSGEIEEGAPPKAMRYFGRDLVIFRAEGGRLVVMDAYCHHLGAHLGHGGEVRGDRVVCPYHGWEWDCDGNNVEVPYSDTTSRRRIPVWETRVIAGMVMVWHDAAGEPPSWELPEIPEANNPDYYPGYPHGCKLWQDLEMPVQLVAENIVDPVHFKYVHGNSEVGETEEFEADGHEFRVTAKLLFGGGKESTWLTPEGPVRGTQEFTSYGLGFIVTRFPDTDQAVEIDCATPVDVGVSDRRSTVLTRRMEGDESDRPKGPSAKRVETTFKLAAQDFPIWEHQRYLDPPTLVKEEAMPMLNMRRWAGQFYPHEPDAAGSHES